MLAPAAKTRRGLRNAHSGRTSAAGPRARARAQTGSLAPQAHVYSLGATLRAALEYVAEPAPRLSRDLEALLGQMQAEDPAHRPDLEVTGSRPLSLP